MVAEELQKYIEEYLIKYGIIDFDIEDVTYEKAKELLELINKDLKK